MSLLQEWKYVISCTQFDPKELDTKEGRRKFIKDLRDELAMLAKGEEVEILSIEPKIRCAIAVKMEEKDGENKDGK